MGSEHESTQFDPEYPTNSVIGVIEDPDQIQPLLSALEKTPIDRDSIDVVSNETAEEQIEQYQDENPLKSKIVDFLFQAGEEAEKLHHYDKWLDEGHYLVWVPVDDDDLAKDVASIIHDHGGHNVNYFSSFTVTNMDI